MMVEANQLLTPANILIILLLVITLGMWLQLVLLRNRLSSRLTRLEERFHEHDQLFDLQAKGTRDMTSISEQLVVATNESKTALEALRRDVVRLADDVRGEVGMSRAIELARAGATKEAVADATGLSLEEAEAIVTFHGRGGG
jgi:predicted Holliday junction resolvase-like endonuclease